MGWLNKLIAPLARIVPKAVYSRDEYLDGTVQLLEGYGRNGAKPWPFNRFAAVEHCSSWVYRCAMGNAQAAASVPLRLYVRAARGRNGKAYHPDTGRELLFRTRPVDIKRRRYLSAMSESRPSGSVLTKAAQFGDEFEEVVDSPVLELLRKANPEMNGFDLLTLAFLMLELTGDAYWVPVMDRVSDRPVELWPLLSQGVRVIPRNQDGDDLIAGYEYALPGVVQPVVFDRAEVLPFRYVNPRSVFYGLGKVEAAWQTLGLFWSEREMQKSLFDNNARPDYLLTIENGMTDSVDIIEAKVNAKLRGTRKAGQFLAATGKVAVTPLAWNPKDVGTTEGLVEEIAGIFGYPVTKLKANDPNRANAESGDAGWMKDTILPMLRCMEEALNQNGYLGLFGSGALLDDAVLAFDDPVPANRKMELAESKTLVAMGIRTTNEDRQLRGDEPIDGGDALRFNGQSVTIMDQLAAAQARQAATPVASPLAGLGGLFAPRAEPKPPAPDATPKPSGAIQPPAIGDTGGSAQNVVEGEKLNGAQITAAKDVLTAVTAGQMAPDVAVELLIAVGIDDERARRMVASAARFKPEPIADSGNSGDGDAVSGKMAVRRDGADHEDAAGRSDGGADAQPERCSCGHQRGGDGAGQGDGDHAGSDGGGEKNTGRGGGDDAGGGDAVHLAAVEPRWMKFLAGAFTKADADDTAREGEPERPGDEMVRVLRGILADMQAEVLSIIGSTKAGRVRVKLKESDLDRIDDTLRKFEQRIADELRPILERIISSGAQSGLAAIEVGDDVFNVTNPEVQRALDTFTEQIKTTIPRTTIEGLRSSLGDGMASGESVQQLQQRVREAGVLNPNRAEQIARSESARAYVQGEVEGWKQSGVVEGKRWLLAPDACEFCKAAAAEFGEATVGLDDAFYAKGSTLTAADGKTMTLDYSDVQGPPLHVNCRCDAVAVLKPVGDSQ